MASGLLHRSLVTTLPPEVAVRGPLEARQVLLEHQVLHNVVRLPQRIANADVLPTALGLTTKDCAAVRCYRTDVGPVAAIVSAGRWPDAALLMAALAVHSPFVTELRQATRDEVNADTDYQAGLVSPLALPCSIVLLADVRLLRSPVVYLPTGDPGTALGMGTRDLLAVTGAKLSVLTRQAPEDIAPEIVPQRPPAWAS
jgi:prolyl-tRNA editing enzyme YbaK/EbsC (Cys-tRNA(Pro) deacylase)